MTTSVSNDDVSVLAVPEPRPSPAVRSQGRGVYRIRHTLPSRFAFLVICLGIVMSALAYGTVHYWALGLFNLGGLTILVLWVLDAWSLGTFRVSRNALQLPLLGALVLGLVQLLPLREVTNDAALAIGLSNTLTFDPHATRLVLVQLATLLIYFSATLVFIDTPHRLHVMVRTIMIFGFCLALFGLTQSFTSPTKVYWMRELNQSTAFGPFINRHHFAGYMELTIALPLGLLFAGAVDKEKRLLYIFVAGLMGAALVMTASRGGIISLVAEVIFFAIVTAIWRKHDGRHRRSSRLKSAALRAGLAVALLVSLFFGVLLLGGEMSINRLIVDSVNTNDPTTGRAHFWSVTLQIGASADRHRPGRVWCCLYEVRFPQRTLSTRAGAQRLSAGVVRRRHHRRGAGAHVCGAVVLQRIRQGGIARRFPARRRAGRFGRVLCRARA